MFGKRPGTSVERKKKKTIFEDKQQITTSICKQNRCLIKHKFGVQHNQSPEITKAAIILKEKVVPTPKKIIRRRLSMDDRVTARYVNSDVKDCKLTTEIIRTYESRIDKRIDKNFRKSFC